MSRRRSLRLLGWTPAMLAAVVIPAAVTAQSPSFLFTVSPGSAAGTPTHFVHADVGYAERVFSAVGAERMEQRLGGQFGLGSRFTLLGQVGYASRIDNVKSSLEARTELLANLFGRSARKVFAVGLGVGRERSRQMVALGRVVGGYRSDRWEAIGNLRLERVVGRDADAVARDGIDVITTAGAAHAVGSVLRLGIEAVAEDIEGFVEKDEAEGGAKLMVGPTVVLAPTGARWNLLLGGGVVTQLTSSTVAPEPNGALRDLQMRNGYILRTSVAYRW